MDLYRMVGIRKEENTIMFMQMVHINLDGSGMKVLIIFSLMVRTEWISL